MRSLFQNHGLEEVICKGIFMTKDNISGSGVNEIKSKISALDIVSKYVSLTKSGERYRGLCPFHQEKTPSFYLDDGNGLYYCFGCQAGGDIIKFLMDIEGWTFIETMRYLSKETGVPFGVDNTRERSEKERLYSVNQRVADYYMATLRGRNGKQAMSYLNNRGFSKEIINTFAVGYALPNWEGLCSFAKSNQINSADLQKLGLIAKSNNPQTNQSFYDKFRNRIIFPIRDVLGSVVGFGARTIGSDEPKYLNSPETMLYHKGSSLYGIYEARNAIKNQDCVILLEGYLDVLALCQAGFNNSIASLGTAFTKEQANIIKRYTSNVIICYDGDSAGVEAVIKAIGVMKNFDFSLKIALIPNGLDPDDYLMKFGKESFKELLDKAMDSMDFIIHQLSLRYDLENRDDKFKFATNLVKMLAKVENRIEQEGYLRSYAEQYKLDKNALEFELNKVLNLNSRDEISINRVESNDLGLRDIIAAQEKKLLKILIDSKKTVSDDIFAIPEHKKICKIMNSHSWESLSDIMDSVKKHKLDSTLASIMINESFEENEVKLFRQLSILSKERRLRTIRRKISETVRVGEDPTDLLQEFRELERERAQLYGNKDFSS